MEKNSQIIGRNRENSESPGGERPSNKLDDPIIREFFEAFQHELNTTRIVDEGTLMIRQTLEIFYHEPFTTKMRRALTFQFNSVVIGF